MKTSRNRTGLPIFVLAIVTAAIAILGATGVLIAQRVPPAVTSVPVCIKGNGQLRVLVEPDATCGPSELRTEWLVGGAKTGRIFSGFNDGPVPMPSGFPVEIARLDLPAGSFAVSAKLTVTNTFGERPDDRALCMLGAEADFDRAELVLPEDVNTVIQHPYNAAAGLTLQLVHHFNAPGSVTLSCYEQDSDPDLSFQDLKITAIESSSLSNVFLAMP
jgi:hypothetical protein